MKIKAAVNLLNQNRYSVKRSTPMQKIGKHSAIAFIFILLILGCSKENINPNQLVCWNGVNISNSNVGGCATCATYADYQKLKDFKNLSWSATIDCSKCR